MKKYVAVCVATIGFSYGAWAWDPVENKAPHSDESGYAAGHCGVGVELVQDAEQEALRQAARGRAEGLAARLQKEDAGHEVLEAFRRLRRAGRPAPIASTPQPPSAETAYVFSNGCFW
jgi:hypothetical protein